MQPILNLQLLMLLLASRSGFGVPIDSRKMTEEGDRTAVVRVPVSATTFQTEGRAFLLRFGYLKDCRPDSPAELTTPASGNPATPDSGNPATPASGNLATPASGNPATPASGNLATPASGNPATPDSGNPATPDSGNPATPDSGNPATPASGNPATPASGNLATPASGNLATPASGNLATPASGNPATPARNPGSKADLHELLGKAREAAEPSKASAPGMIKEAAKACRSSAATSDLAEAILAFQVAYELPRTGQPDPPTLDAMNERRCGLADSPDALAIEAGRVPPSPAVVSGHRCRRGRSVLHDQLPSNDRFPRRQITWELEPGGESHQLPREFQRRLLADAFRLWSTVTPVYFRELPEPATAADWSGRPAADVSVSFQRLQHGVCRHAFDGRGNEVSHSRAAGPIHIDADEDFSSAGQQQSSSTAPSIDLRQVFAHEIGHTLGLLHSGRVDSIMHPANVLRLGGPAPQIRPEERKLVQKNYGACSARFNTVLDWIRADPQRGYPIYNTYIFSCDSYWLFDNSAGLPRLGDPRPIGHGWPGVPDGLDAALELVDWDPAGRDNTYRLFFFFGVEFVEFDSVQKAAKPGYPKKIADCFGPKLGYQFGIPDSIDSAFFDYATGLVYFFKGSWVYIYNPGSAKGFKFNNCCEGVRKIADRFPTAPGDKPLQLPVDSVYFRLADNGLYFISGRELWQDVAYSPFSPPVGALSAAGLLRYHGRVSDKWPDLCFTEPSKCDLSEPALLD